MTGEMFPSDYFRLDAHGLVSRLIEDAAIELGMSVERVSERIVVCERDGLRLVFYRSCSNTSSYGGKQICDDKAYTKSFLQRAGIEVSPYRVFDGAGMESAGSFAQELGWNVVLKPCLGTVHRESVPNRLCRPAW